MGNIESIELTTTSNFWIILLCIVLLISYSYYIYRYTLPSISNFNRYFLIILRSFIVILICLLIFEPLLSLSKKEEIQLKNYIFIDNSKSITVKDSSYRSEKIKEFVDRFDDENNFEIRSFGNSIRSINPNFRDSLIFNEPNTNIANIFSYLDKINDNINSVVILSDGIITEGSDPTYSAEKSNYPIFTIGIGDTSRIFDTSVKDIIYNQFIYKGKTTQIEAIITNFSLPEKPAVITIYEDDKLIDSKNIILSDNGINKVAFDYTPNESGEKKISISVSSPVNEENKINNKKSVFINILESKIKIVVVSGTPSPDLSSIIQSLSANKDFDVKSLIQIAPNKYWGNANLNSVDSADVLFLIDFPSSSTSQQLIAKVINALNNNKPYFIQVSSSNNLNQLKSIEAKLPFTIGQMNQDNIQVQPDPVSGAFSSTFSGMAKQYNLWNNLPPVEKNLTVLNAKPESQILLRIKIRNVPVNSPLLISKAVANQRSLALLCSGIWRWKLSTSEKYPEFFPDFFNNIVKWLNNANMKKQFLVRTDKKIYAIGEQVEFTAELYDQTFTPVDSADIKLAVSYKDKTDEILFTKLQNGLYQAYYELNDLGDFSYNASAEFNGSKILSNTGKFNVTDFEIEKMDTKMNSVLLNQIAQLSGGKFYPIDNSTELIEEIQKIYDDNKKDKVSYTKTEIWSNEWIMIIIICLFALEWFLRKRFGML